MEAKFHITMHVAPEVTTGDHLQTLTRKKRCTFRTTPCVLCCGHFLSCSLVECKVGWGHGHVEAEEQRQPSLLDNSWFTQCPKILNLWMCFCAEYMFRLVSMRRRWLRSVDSRSAAKDLPSPKQTRESRGAQEDLLGEESRYEMQHDAFSGM